MFKFSIRDVLWLTMVVGLTVGWWVERREANKARAWRDEALEWQAKSKSIVAELNSQFGIMADWDERGGPYFKMPTLSAEDSPDSP